MYNSAANLVFAYALTYGTSKVINSISNANPAIAAFATGHAIAVGDVFVIDTNDYGRLEEVVQRASAVTADNITLENVDTTDTFIFPAGGAGTAREVLTWGSIKGIINISVSGDDQAFETLTPFDKGGRQIEVPTDRSPAKVELTFSHNAVLQTWYTNLVALDGKNTKVVFRMKYPDGLTVYLYGFVKIAQIPTQEGMNNPKGKIRFSGVASVFGN